MPRWAYGDAEWTGQENNPPVGAVPPTLNDTTADDKSQTGRSVKGGQSCIVCPHSGAASMPDVVLGELRVPNGEVDAGEDIRADNRTGDVRGANGLLSVSTAAVRPNGAGCTAGLVEVPMLSRGSVHLSAGVGSGISFRSPRVMGLVMASPFLLCFLLFGVINITAGTLITLASMRIKEEHRASAIMTDSTSAALSPADSPSSTHLPQTRATLNSIARHPGRASTIAEHGGLQMKQSDGHNGTIDARRLVGMVLLFAGTTLICIGGGIGYVACRSVTSASSLSSAPSKKSSKTPAQSIVVERETLIATTVLGDHRPSNFPSPSPLLAPPVADVYTGPVAVAMQALRHGQESDENVLASQQLIHVVTGP